MHTGVHVSRCLSLEDLLRAALGEPIVIDESSIGRLDEARRVYEEEARRREIYGYCTGLGALQGSRISCGPEAEAVILREHAVGAGDYAPPGLTRAFLAARLSQLLRGGAPVRGRIALYISRALNSGIVPAVPLYGSVGASGDLAPSAHAFRCLLLGEGEAYYKGSLTSCSEALKDAGLEPPSLEPGEALALINNTAWSTVLTGLAILGAEKLLRLSLRVLSAVLPLIGFNREHFSVEACKAKAHRTQAEIAAALEAIESFRDTGRLQDPYSIRCTPQIYGAALEALNFARKLVESEACSSSENPVVASGRVYHACNFHTAYVALASEATAWATASLANSITLRIHHYMDSRITGLADFLAETHSSVGAMIAEYLGAALAAASRAMATSYTIHWIPTSMNQEDANPMTPNSAIRLYSLLDKLAWLVSLEATMASLIASARGASDKLGINASLEDLHESILRARRILVDPILPQSIYKLTSI